MMMSVDEDTRIQFQHQQLIDRTTELVRISNDNSNVRVGAYYYTWYNEQQWYLWKTKYMPTLGYYDILNTTIIQQHVHWAKHVANIDFFIISYSRNIPTILQYLNYNNKNQESKKLEGNNQQDSHQSKTKSTRTKSATRRRSDSPEVLPIVLHVESLILYQRSITTYYEHLERRRQSSSSTSSSNSSSSTNTDAKPTKYTFRYNGEIDFQRTDVMNFYNSDTTTTTTTTTSSASQNSNITFGECFIQYIFKAMDDIVIPYQDSYIFVNENENEYEDSDGSSNPLLRRRPVFVLYLARDYINYNDTFNELRKRFQERYNSRIDSIGVPYYIADSIWLPTDTKRKYQHDTQGAIYHWDAMTAYNRYEGQLRNYANDNVVDYLRRIEYEYTIYSTTTTTRTKTETAMSISQPNQQHQQQDVKISNMVPYVQPGYDDILIRGHETPKNRKRPIYERTTNDKAVLEYHPHRYFPWLSPSSWLSSSLSKSKPISSSSSSSNTFHMFWDLAERILNKNPCSSSISSNDPGTTDATSSTRKRSSHSSPTMTTTNPSSLFVFISTFNEWHESTSIEPSIEWRNEYLHITRERTKNLQQQQQQILTTCRRKK